jgi:hypothetical protein
MQELSLAVVGLDFPNRDKSNRRFEVALCAPGDPVELRPDPKNPVDPRAVAVLSERGVQLGYLTAERCGMVGKKLRDGEPYRAVFQEADRHKAVIRVRFGGGEPTLPARDAEPEPDKYAQPSWDD